MSHAVANRIRALMAGALASLAVLAPACSDGPSSDPLPIAPTPVGCTDGEPGCIGWQTCPPELERDPDGAGCREILPEGDCAPGTMAVLGERACVPVGPASCAPGFEKAASGWGCEAVMPSKACSGATRDALGSTTCVPVGDCAAPFPPRQLEQAAHAPDATMPADRGHRESWHTACFAAFLSRRGAC